LHYRNFLFPNLDYYQCVSEHIIPAMNNYHQ
jgi:hypothetical protein